MNKETILQNIVEILEQSFDIAADKITLESTLYEELDLDSIDAIDLVVKIQNITGRKIDPEDFKAARTINDVVDIIHRLTNR